MHMRGVNNGLEDALLCDGISSFQSLFTHANSIYPCGVTTSSVEVSGLTGSVGGGGDLEWWVQHYVSIELLLNCNMDMIYLPFEMRHNNISGCVIRSMVISVALIPTHTNGQPDIQVYHSSVIS